MKEQRDEKTETLRDSLVIDRQNYGVTEKSKDSDMGERETKRLHFRRIREKEMKRQIHVET
jgi:hypothetical protein